MAPTTAVAGLFLLAVLLMMGLEALLSRHHERVLRSRGAIEAQGDVYRLMQIAYPLGFCLIAIEGVAYQAVSPHWLAAGLAVFTVAKALKFWVILSLGTRWSFKVLVVPGEPLVTAGPYRFVRHPNYAAVLGEFVGMAMALSAPVSGVIVTLGFGSLLWQRVQVEDRALGRR